MDIKEGDSVIWNKNWHSHKWLESAYGKGPFKVTRVKNGRITIEEFTAFDLRSDCFKLYQEEKPSPPPRLKNHCNLL